METDELKILLGLKERMEKDASSKIVFASNGRMMLAEDVEEYEKLLNEIEQNILKQSQEKIEKKIEELVVKPTKEELQALLEQELIKMEDKKYYQKIKEKVRIESLKADDLIEKGKTILFEERFEAWKRVVNEAEAEKQLKYIDYVVKIMEVIKSPVDIDKAKELYESYKPAFEEDNCEVFVKNCVLIYSKFGPEFYRATTPGNLTIKEKIVLEELERQNAELRNLHNSQNPVVAPNNGEELNRQPIVNMNDGLDEEPLLNKTNSNNTSENKEDKINSTLPNDRLGNGTEPQPTPVINQNDSLTINIDSELSNIQSLDDDDDDLNKSADNSQVNGPVTEEKKSHKLFKVIKKRTFKWFNKGIKTFEKMKALIVKDALNNKSQEYVDIIINIENFKNSYMDNSYEENEKIITTIKHAIADSNMTPKERERAYDKLNKAKAKLQKELNKAITRESRRLNL